MLGGLLFTDFCVYRPVEIQILSITGTRRHFDTKSESAVYIFRRPLVPSLPFCIQHVFLNYCRSSSLPVPGGPRQSTGDGAMRMYSMKLCVSLCGRASTLH